MQCDELLQQQDSLNKQIFRLEVSLTGTHSEQAKKSLQDKLNDFKQQLAAVNDALDKQCK